MLPPPNGEHGSGADYFPAFESRWLDETPVLRLLGHVTFTLFLMASLVAAVAVCL